MVLLEISEDGIRVLTRPLEATFTFTLITQCPVEKWHFVWVKTEILDLVSKHETKGKKFSISSRSMRLKGRNSRSRLKAWDWKEEILDLVSKHETERKIFSISSRSMRLKGRNSRSRLESWNRHLVMLCFGSIFRLFVSELSHFTSPCSEYQVVGQNQDRRL